MVKGTGSLLLSLQIVLFFVAFNNTQLKTGPFVPRCRPIIIFDNFSPTNGLFTSAKQSVNQGLSFWVQTQPRPEK